MTTAPLRGCPMRTMSAPSLVQVLTPRVFGTGRGGYLAGRIVSPW